MPQNKKKLDVGEDAELAVGASGAVIAIDQIMKSLDSKEHQTSHLVKAGIGAAVALGAYSLLQQDEAKGRKRRPSVSSSKSESRSRSSSPHIKHHDRHLAEEILGAYALGKELMGDKRHRIVHLVGETIGAAGAWQDMRARDEAEKHNR